MLPKIVHIGTWDAVGGAAIASYRLHTSLLKAGYDSKMYVRDKTKMDREITRFNPPVSNLLYKLNLQLEKRNIARSFKPYANTRQKDKEVFTMDKTMYGDFTAKQIPEADIIHLHWISNFMDIESTFRFLSASGKRVVWTLHDMNAFTGGCHHDDDCGRYANACGSCPQLGSSNPVDLSHQIWQRKMKAYRSIPQAHIKIATDSDWLTNCARKSAHFKDFDISTVHYGLDTDIFAPRDKAAARKLFGIDEKKTVIAFGAANLNNRRKGLHFLLEAMGFLEKDYPDLLLLIFGDGTFETSLKIPILSVGPVINYHMLSFLYNAADIFVISSVREAFGQTCLEAMSCGTPVVGFNGGGIPDMIKDGYTGYLAEEWNSKSLAQAIKRLTDSPQMRKDMAVHARSFVLENFSLDLQLHTYLSIYNKLLAS